jgi:hypothetical protein
VVTILASIKRVHVSVTGAPGRRLPTEGELDRTKSDYPTCFAEGGVSPMIRKLQSGQYRLYSRKVNPKTGKRRNLGTFKSRAAAEKHERAVQYFKRH